jgi:S-adenosylmethionine:tRNA ribosyltransferase-isomerase
MPRDIRIEDFAYELPEDRIAQYPLPERDASQLLVYREGSIKATVFRQLAAQLPPASLLIYNDTRVLHARLRTQLPNGRDLEIFLLDPLEPSDYQLNLSSSGPVTWKCLIGGNRRWKSGELQFQLWLNEHPITIEVRRGERFEDGSFAVRFTWDRPELSFSELLPEAGSLPIPPYLNRETEQSDLDRYQTVFARYEGSVAAPTAGLHFTPRVLADLDERSVRRAGVTLHVGAGTFRPVRSETLADHPMHEEMISVPRPTLAQLLDQLQHGRPIVAVGTTSMRTLESLYWIGLRLLNGRSLETEVLVDQWEAYDVAATATAFEALQAIQQYLVERDLQALQGRTRILIAPGYRARIITALITNFHQPGSTLLLLIASIVGDDWRKIYDFALAQDFRFLSYGDSSLLWVRPDLPVG